MAIRDAADLLAHTNTKSRAPYPFRNDTRRTDATQRSTMGEKHVTYPGVDRPIQIRCYGRE
jgi:hypothetical protein